LKAVAFSAASLREAFVQSDHDGEAEPVLKLNGLEEQQNGSKQAKQQ
jgi:hypothetical protein